jgi:hypothetical protein
LDRWTNNNEPRAPGACSRGHEPTAVLLGIGWGLLESATPLDWTTLATLSDYADQRRRSSTGLTRVRIG